MRRHRLLRSSSGSAPLEAIFAMLVTLTLALGIVQVALTLYARNVVVAAAHEGARAAVELGSSRMDASRVAQDTISDSAGRLVNDLAVDVAIQSTARPILTVRVSADLRALGPLPLEIPIDTTATAALEETS